MKNKNVLITGSSKGLGKELAIAFARNGANVVINYYHNESSALETFEEVSKFGTKVEIIKADVGNAEEMASLCKTAIARMGAIDIFIHNAVHAFKSSLSTIDSELWSHAFNINLNPLLIGAQELTPYMKEKQWGRILAITSLGSELAVKNYAAIGVPKAAMEALIRYMAVEFGPYGITSNTISPGTLNTESLRKLNPNFHQRIEAAQSNIPFKRPMEIEDVAKVILTLCSDEMEMINGEIIRVDGGMRIMAQVEGL
ncbi:SDR family oxidoreductase [Neobacillus niacini]|uniref:SDR family oxidoreductase n=1 Tax=Neobacillus niacini TaxID=86668 RepID=UPI0021CAE4ED|nr:SDR family oxidoreductase [Neobacillus niacini]MCM3766162.1 SDR family oxidoreductase [Neobacillus niacini]